MNKKLMRLLAGAALALSTSTASAVVIDIGTLSLDVTQGTFTNAVDVGGESGVYWSSDLVYFDPIVVNVDDVLNVGFEFLEGQTLELINGAYNTGREIFQFRQLSNLIPNQNTSTVSFTGVEGDLNFPGVFSTTSSAGFFNGTISANVTDTSFAFHDIHFQTDYFFLGGFGTVSSLQLRVVATDVNAHVSIHEPASLALMGLGLVGLGFARRKKAA